MVFLLAAHTLNRDVIVANVTRLTMHGKSFSNNRATIVCNRSARLNFVRVVESQIFATGRNMTLLLESTQYVELILFLP